MTFKEKNEKQEVLSNLNLIKQLRKLTKDEKIIERHLVKNVGILAMCDRFWQLGIDKRNAAMAK